jgi:hypothetical protein
MPQARGLFAKEPPDEQTGDTTIRQGKKSAANSPSREYALDQGPAMASSDEKTSMLAAEAHVVGKLQLTLLHQIRTGT